MKVAQRLVLELIRIKFSLLGLLSKRAEARCAFRLFRTPSSRDVLPIAGVFLEAEILTLSFGEHSVTGYRWNAGGTRRVLIAHGFESASINFAHFVQPLVDKGYEVLSFDAPAHGRSAGKRIDAIIYRDMILAIENAFGPIESFLAHSFGALAVVLAVENLPPVNDRRIALVAPMTETTTAINHFLKIIRLNNPRTRTQFARMAADYAGRPPEWFSIVRAIRHINASVIWIHDRDDEVTPFSDARSLVNENRGNLHFVITEGLGHRRIYRDKEVGRMIVEFL